MTDHEAQQLLLQRIRDERIQLRRDIAHYRNWKFYPVDVEGAPIRTRKRSLRRAIKLSLGAILCLPMLIALLVWVRP